MSKITGRPKKAAGEKYVKRLICFPPEVAELLDRLPRGERSAFVTAAVLRFAEYLQSFSPAEGAVRWLQDQAEVSARIPLSWMREGGIAEMGPGPHRRLFLSSAEALTRIQEAVDEGVPCMIGGIEYHAPGAEVRDIEVISDRCNPP